MVGWLVEVHREVGAKVGRKLEVGRLEGKDEGRKEEALEQQAVVSPAGRTFKMRLSFKNCFF